MDYQYGLRPASNRMAMARGAKFMKVHNLPGWYNTNGNLFGETRVRPTHTHAGLGSVHVNKAGFGYIQKSNGSYHAIINKILAHTGSKHGSRNVRAYSLGNTPTKKWAELRNESYLSHAAVLPARPKSPNTVFNFPNVNVYPLIGTRAKGGGYVINKLGKNKPAKYEDVVKGIHAFALS